MGTFAPQWLKRFRDRNLPTKLGLFSWGKRLLWEGLGMLQVAVQPSDIGVVLVDPDGTVVER